MKKILYACCAAVFFILMLSGCDKAEPLPDEWKELKYAADTFTLEDAKREGYVVMEDGDVTCGQEAWQNFVDLSSKKIPCKIRVVHYYTLGDPSDYDPEYYESIKDDYPMMFILEVDYNGETFRVGNYEGEKLYTSEFKYLMKYEGESETPTSTFTSYVRYVLVNDDKVTWNDIMHGVTSSKLEDYIPFREIYADLVYKEGYK
ncbi:MAG TPA: hypothetical protein PLH43_04415 [Acetivibrio sp.]|uniref:hypothetical protein n=1 Tax=Acetivibrio sp. TaxID=1872092 RepID=UPI002C6E4D20|nr:hypothetical protein [Acetivibrio sp.]HOM02054.1 hypothetical protein [Acetivibrio sp.]